MLFPDCQKALNENNDTLVTTTPSLAAAQLVTSDNYTESPAVMTTLHATERRDFPLRAAVVKQ